MTEPLFGRVEAAALLAVESANGGEWADLEQVASGYLQLFKRMPEVDDFSFACALLCEADLIAYAQGGLELTPKGRKLLRHSGMPSSPARPGKVTDLLNAIADADIADEGSVPEPTLDEISTAIGHLSHDFGAGDGPMMGADVAPLGGVPGIITSLGHIGGQDFRFRLPGTTPSPDNGQPDRNGGPPLVPPAEES
jgi:hypothetical protein